MVIALTERILFWHDNRNKRTNNYDDTQQDVCLCQCSNIATGTIIDLFEMYSKIAPPKQAPALH